MSKIFISINMGFGNKLMNLIIGLYTKYINNMDLYLLVFKSEHETNDDKTIIDIFPGISNYATILNNWKEVDDIFPMDTRIIHSCEGNADVLHNFKKDNTKNHIIKTPRYCYRFVMDFYNELPNDYKNMLRINEQLLLPSTHNLVDKNYVSVHIRYGDKLDISSKDDQYHYIIYTPDVYIQFINYFLKKNWTVYILTDDVKIVSEFIVNKIKSTNKLILLDIPFIDSFYILSKAVYSFLSISSFSMLAAIMNTKLKKGYIIDRYDHMSRAISEESINLPKQVKRIKNKRYILNDDVVLMKKMIKHRE